MEPLCFLYRDYIVSLCFFNHLRDSDTSIVETERKRKFRFFERILRPWFRRIEERRELLFNVSLYPDDRLIICTKINERRSSFSVRRKKKILKTVRVCGATLQRSG